MHLVRPRPPCARCDSDFQGVGGLQLNKFYPKFIACLFSVGGLGEVITDTHMANLVWHAAYMVSNIRSLSMCSMLTTQI